MREPIKKSLLFMPLWLLANGAFAQTNNLVDSNVAFYVLAGFILIIALLVLGVCVVVLRLLRFMVKEQSKIIAKEKGIAIVEEESFWDKLWSKANDTMPVELEEEIMLDHDYDGIKELDNHLPPWWKWTFYISIIFAVVYMVNHHMLNNMPLQIEEYQAEMSLAEEQKLALQASLPEMVIDENNVEQLTDAAALAKGKQVFNINCAQCHKESGAGGIGPNLTDDYWLNGGSMTDIYRTIKIGVPDKGMISWESTLSVARMHQVASYIMTMKGTNPPNAKAPQGELYTPPPAIDLQDSVMLDSAQTEKIADGRSL